MTTSMFTPFVSSQMVYWDQLDLMGVLHNGAYPNLMERARTAFWRHCGVTGYGDPKFDWPYMVARNEVDYKSPIRTEQKISVTVFIWRIGSSSITFGHEILAEDGSLAATGSTVLVRVDPETERPIPWSDAFREMVSGYIKPPSD